MKFTIKFFITALLILGTVAVFISCKKTATNEANPQSELLESFKKKYKDEPFSFTQSFTIPVKQFIADQEGNKITVNQNSRTTACSAFSGDNYVYQYPLEVTTNLVCGQGYQIIVSYIISTNFVPQLTSGTGVPSFGRVKLSNSSNVLIWPTAVPAPKFNVYSIVSLGSDGNSPNDGEPLTKYKITYKTDYIPNATYNNATKLETSLFIYTNCTDMTSYPIGYVQQQAVLYNTAIDQSPCLRIDKVYWTTSSGLGASTGGCNYIPNSCFPSNYVFPDKQEIEININGTWRDLRLWRWDASGPPGTKEYNTIGEITVLDVWYIEMTGYPGSPSTISAGTYNIRYRNKQTGASNGGPCETQPSGTWVTESWYISI